MWKKCVIFATIAWLFSPSVAFASPKIPAEYYGEWCSSEGHPYFLPVPGDTCFKVFGHRFELEDGVCEPLKITPDKSGHVVELRCKSVEDQISTRTEHWSRTTGTNGRGKRFYIDAM